MTTSVLVSGGGGGGGGGLFDVVLLSLTFWHSLIKITKVNYELY
jgi:uncharacterized membrane protein